MDYPVRIHQRGFHTGWSCRLFFGPKKHLTPLNSTMRSASCELLGGSAVTTVPFNCLLPFGTQTFFATSTAITWLVYSIFNSLAYSIN